MLLKGKKILVTGGSSGIGRAVSEIFVKNGADVVLFASNEERLKQAAEELESLKVDSSQKIAYKAVDVSNTKLVDGAVKDLLDDPVWGAIDVLVNNAGITKDAFLIKMSEEDWDKVLQVNLKSVFNVSKAVSRQMMKAKKGKIINMASVIGLAGNSCQTNYAASKAGIIGFTKALAKELAGRNICVNCIAPGYISTKMTEVLPQAVKDKMLEAIPLKRFGCVEDIAFAALFLASYMSDYITGQVIVVDGGLAM